jgi:hypothetical protein
MTYEARLYVPYKFKVKDGTRTAASDPTAAPWTTAYSQSAVTGVFVFTEETNDSNGRRGRKLLDISETGDRVMKRVLMNSSGAKVNLDGTTQADTVYGSLTAMCRCYGSPNYAHSYLLALESLQGVQGTLLAALPGGGATTYYYSALAYITVGQPRRRTELAWALGKMTAIDIPITFDRLGGWSDPYPTP